MHFIHVSDASVTGDVGCEIDIVTSVSLSICFRVLHFVRYQNKTRTAVCFQCTQFDIRKSSCLRLFVMITTLLLIYATAQVNVVSAAFVLGAPRPSGPLAIVRWHPISTPLVGAVKHVLIHFDTRWTYFIYAKWHRPAFISNILIKNKK